MKTTTYKVIFILLALFVSFKSQSQDYKTGIGVRLGNIYQGITVKHFVNPTGALEGIASFGFRSFLITGLYEKHQPISGAEGLKWFFGGGAHIGFYNYGYHYYYYRYKHGNYIFYDSHPSSTNIGLDFILGLEYKIQKAPITLGVDVKPFIDLVEGGPYFIWQGAFTVRFTL